MIPIKLTIEGLYSYQKRQVIDFETLTSNHLFGIFGKVGSGKSSILEAITFALYGKTDRLLIKDDNRNYNMMNLKSNQLFIEFDFSIGKNASQFRVNALAKRNSKNYEDVKKIERTCYKLIGNDYIPISSDELEQEIGLSYDNFKRTIIIPQGKFQEFLQLKSTERTRMMKELFNLHKYELYGNVKNIESKNNALIQNIEGRLEQLGEVSADQLDLLLKQKQDFENQLLVLNKQDKQNEVKLSELQKLKENTLLVKKLSGQKSKLEEQQEHIEKQEKELNSYESCQIQFKSKIDHLASLKSNINRLEGTIKQDSSLLDKDQQDLNKLISEFEKIKAEYDRLEVTKQQIDNLKKMVEVVTLTESIEKEQGRLTEGKDIVLKVLSSIEKLENEEKELNSSLLKIKSELPNIEIINKAQQWFIEEKNIHSTILELKKDAEKTERAKIKLADDLIVSLKKHQLSIDINNLNTSQSKLKQSQQQTEELHKSLKQELEHLLIQSGLEKYAQKLEEGEACPLCGSENHPKPFSSELLGEQITKTKQEIAKQEKLLQNLNDSQLLISNYFAAVKPLETQIQNINDKLSEFNTKNKDHKKNIIEVYNEEYKLQEASKNYKQCTEKITQIEELLQQARNKFSLENKNKEKYQEALNNIQRDIDKKQNSIEVLMSQISDDIKNSCKSQTIDQIVSRYQKLEELVRKVISDYEELTKKIEDLNNRVRTITAKIDTNQTHLKSEIETSDKVTNDLTSLVENSHFKDVEEVKRILNLNLDIPKTKELIKNFFTQLQLLNIEIEKLSANIGDNVYDERIHQKLIEEAECVKNKITELNQLLGKVKLELKTLEETLLKKKELSVELKKLQLRADDISTLRKMFFKSGFVNYVSSVYLQNLCTTANERFYKMTRQSLSLELSKDNNFEVRDYMNGGKLRNIKTLSGGQTFQAALALALALADNIQSLTEADRNFFFLDEGFGSLDKESLEVVFSTLKTLRNENRIVGVISHVEEMQQEISTFLSVEQDEDTGSNVIESWNR